MIHVLTVRARMRETFQAFAALERFFAGVQSLVFGQMMLVLKCFRTFDALVWTLACKEYNKERRLHLKYTNNDDGDDGEERTQFKTEMRQR